MSQNLKNQQQAIILYRMIFRKIRRFYSIQ
jgi:hypothetical protein